MIEKRIEILSQAIEHSMKDFQDYEGTDRFKMQQDFYDSGYAFRDRFSREDFVQMIDSGNLKYPI
jgi:hypothetical protein